MRPLRSTQSLVIFAGYVLRPAIYDAIMLRFNIFVMGVHRAVLLAMLGLYLVGSGRPKSCH